VLALIQHIKEGSELVERFDRYSMRGADVDSDDFIDEYHVVPKTGNWHRLLAWARHGVLKSAVLGECQHELDEISGLWCVHCGERFDGQAD
jgi:hypothetical protein